MKSAEKENLRMNIDYFYITFIVLKKDNIILKEEVIYQRRWTIIALRNLIFYFWSNIELTWHECSFMSQITNYKEKM